MHRELVEERSWIDEPRYLKALNFCMLLPGPEAMQLATYVGWRLHGVKGGLAAGLLFVVPGALVVLTLSMLYAAFGKLPLVEALFVGIKAAVLAHRGGGALLRIADARCKRRRVDHRRRRVRRDLLPGRAVPADRAYDGAGGSSGPRQGPRTPPPPATHKAPNSDARWRPSCCGSALDRPARALTAVFGSSPRAFADRIVLLHAGSA